MDYGEGSLLAKWQWDEMSVPAIFDGFFEGDKEAEYTTDGHYYTIQLTALMMGFDPQKAYYLGVAAENPDSYAISPSEMQERATWADAGLQQRFHALTGGYHGVELAITAYAILKTHSEGDISEYLWHRFGDDFAHINMDYDGKGLTSYLSISQYVTALDNFINSYLANNFVFVDNMNVGDYIVGSLPFTKVRTTESKNVIIKEFIDYMLAANHASKFYNIDSWEDLQDKILKSFSFYAEQNSFKMYGTTQILPCWTLGHAFVGHEPDNIRDRKDLFLLYVNNLIDLLSIKYNKQISAQQKAKIIEKFSRIIEASSQTPTDRLDGILSFEIAILKNPDAKQITIYIPIKYLAPDLTGYEKQSEKKAGFDPNKDTKEQTDNLARYISSDPDLSKIYVLGDAIPTSDGVAMKFTIFKK